MKRRILVIDDDEAILQSCQMILEDEGFEVELAGNGEAGLALLRHSAFDLALLDLKLPGATGLQVLEQARKVDPELTIIIFTAFGTIESAVDAIKMGAFNYISKPFTASQLMAVLNNGLRHRDLVRENAVLHRELKNCCPQDQIIGASQALQSCLAEVAKVACSEA